MRLLNVHTLEFKTFFTEQDRPPYVITSHRWVDDEITFQQFLAHKSDASVRQTAGFQKIQSFCDFVKGWSTDLDLTWIWIDTCCIDKTSSSELQEAINSMFRWYSDSHVCLAYLNDVRSLDATPMDIMKDFEGSVWFRRGWTLQELLAPSMVVFLSSEWEVIGHKASSVGQEPLTWGTKVLRPFNGREIRLSLNHWIARAAHIQEDIIADYKKSVTLSIAEKRSWMDNRRTTRVEDSAYCLLGICGIYLPLIYGEREQAFDRLEEAIERRTLKANAQTSYTNTSRSSSAAPATVSDPGETDWSDGERSEATINWHEIAGRHKDKGNKHYKNGQYEAAIEEYTHAIQTFPESSLYFGNRAAAYMMMMRYREAIDDCNRALDIDPTNRKITERLEKAKTALNQTMGGAPDKDRAQGSQFDRSPSPMREFREHASRSSFQAPQRPVPDINGRYESERVNRSERGHHDGSYSKDIPQEDESRRFQFDEPKEKSGGIDPEELYAQARRFQCDDPKEKSGGIDPEELFAQFFSGSGDQFNNSGSRPRSSATEPTIVEKQLPVSLEDIFNGAEKKLKVTRKTYDPRTGREVVEDKVLVVPIKRGLKAGSKIKFSEIGDEVDGRFQDLHFIINDKPHPLFVRNVDDLEHTIRISLAEAASGWSRTVSTIDGKQLNVKKTGGTSSNWTDCYPGQGMPNSKTPTIRGDLIIKVRIG